VFLDEIGELDLMLQVKLLRVVQQRTYTALGDDRQQQFLGKIIGATNRNLDQEMTEGRFREDLYYRLCADRIQTWATNIRGGEIFENWNTASAAS
jgi:transcriptional regulator with PAS, ATPase and Fis domain